MSRGMLRTAAVGALTIVLGLGLAAPSLAAGARKQPRPQVSTTTPGAGQQLVLAGRLTTHLKRKVRLQQRTAGHRWSTVGRTHTTRRGVYVFSTITPSTPGRVSYRAVAPRKGSHKKLVSRVRTVTVSLTSVSAPGGPTTGGGSGTGTGGGSGGGTSTGCPSGEIGVPPFCVPGSLPPLPSPPSLPTCLPGQIPVPAGIPVCLPPVPGLPI